MFYAVFVLFLIFSFASADSFPPPFYRALDVQQPLLSGNDVTILQNLLGRAVNVTVTGVFDAATSTALAQFQSLHYLSPNGGALDPLTATVLLQTLSNDGYVEDGVPAAALGYLYKIVIHVHSNRSIEHVGHLHDANNALLLSFIARAHGYDCDCPTPWPHYNATSCGLSQFATNGNTPTGLMELDLNTPEPNATEFGPYNVNRAVKGLRGNAAFLLPNIRNGILVHTGEWPGWKPPGEMPNSAGCVHSWPEGIKDIAEVLKGLGVVARPNPGGVLPYPYKPQGLLSVWQDAGDDCLSLPPKPVV